LKLFYTALQGDEILSQKLICCAKANARQKITANGCTTQSPRLNGFFFNAACFLVVTTESFTKVAEFNAWNCAVL